MESLSTSVPQWVGPRHVRQIRDEQTNRRPDPGVRRHRGRLPRLAPSWNIKPTQTIPVVIESAKGEGDVLRRLEPARWTLTPSWSKELKTRFPTFNARSEGITEKATWKGP